MRRLPARLLLASIAFVTALVALATLSVRTLRSTLGLTESMARRQIEALDTNERIDDLLFQKGYVSDYLATGDPRWLAELAQRKRSTTAWLDQVLSKATTSEQRTLAQRLKETYGDYDASRDRMLATFHAGQRKEALLQLGATHAHINEVLDIAHQLAHSSRTELLGTLAEGQGIFRQTELWIAILTAFTSIMGIGFGLWVSHRVARPIYELIVQVESAQQGRVRVESSQAPADEVETLSQHVRGLLGQLDEQRRRLLQAEKMEALGEIAAKLAHEILNPVAGAKVALQAVSRTTALPAETRSTLQEVDRTLSRIDTILSRLVRYARPLEPRLQSASIPELVARAIQAARHELEARRVPVTTALPDLPLAELDPNLMLQVLTNLLVNSAQASQPRSEVRIEAARAPGKLILRVVDHGQGLPANREKLFRPFFTTREGGNGLGLATCQNIVAEHGGTIEACDSDGGVGATFTVTLPQRTDAWTSPS